MAITLNLKNLEASVTNVKTNSDTDQDGEKDVRAHIDFKAEIPAEVMDQLSLGDSFSFKDVFFTTEGDVKNIGIKSMDIDRKYEDHRLTIQHDRLNEVAEVVLTAEIHKLVLIPVHGHRFILRFRAVANPGIKNIGFIAESQITACVVSVEPIQLDMVEDGRADD